MIAKQTYRLGGKVYLVGREIPESVVEKYDLQNVTGSEADDRLASLEKSTREAKAVVQGAQKSRESVSLDAVPFTQTSVQEEAEELGLEPADFEGHEPSSDKGYTASDVRNIAGA